MSRRQKKPEKEGNHERWLISYADFITLLFAVFVTLYAMSQTDKRKMDQLVASLRESFGYVKTGASSEKLNLTESTDLRSIPSVRQEVLTPGLRQFPAGIKYVPSPRHQRRNSWRSRPPLRKI